MTPERIWWEQIGSSIRLIDTIAAALEDEQSLVLRIPDGLPWRDGFYKTLDIRMSAIAADRQLRRLKWNCHEEPGEFILRRLCPQEVQANYYPGQSIPAYLSSLDNLVLSDCYIWISDVYERDDICKWISFINDYRPVESDSSRKAIFIIEYAGPQVETGRTRTVEFRVEEYNCKVFCLELAYELKNTDVPVYQAELAHAMGERNPEFGTLLLNWGEDFLKDPVFIAQTILEHSVNSVGRAFEPAETTFLESCIRRANMVTLYPILEQVRISCIMRHEEQLRNCLPIKNSNGETITEPYELELGGLCHIITNGMHIFYGDEIDRLRVCKKVRNLIAHNRSIEFEDVKRILGCVKRK